MGRGQESVTLNYLVYSNKAAYRQLLFKKKKNSADFIVSSIHFNRVFLLFPQIELIDRVDDIYRNTTWDDEFKGYGVQIHQVRACVRACG